MSAIWFAIASALMLSVPSPVLAQSVVETHIGVGVANLVVPTVSVGADAISPRGLSVGGSATLATTGAWALYGVSARAGLHGRSYGKNQAFVLAELGYFNETDCCGATPLIGVSFGLTRRRSHASALRVEGRLLLPLAGEGGLIVFQIGRTFR